MKPLPWQAVPIDECHEPLLRLVSHGRVFAAPIYRQLGFSKAISDIYLRSRLIERLRAAANYLPADFTLVVWDGWRPIGLQRQLYDTYRTRLAADSGLEGDKLDKALSRFITVSSLDPACPSPHLTGGAIDLGLSDENGRPLDMGSKFDELTDRSRGDYYQTSGKKSEVIIHDRRQLLHLAMGGQGFTNFETEWWHFNYGNQSWASETKESAIYGLVSPYPTL